MGKRFVITGIGTDVGKTVVSAIFAEALRAAYWKPVQAGDLDYTDSHKVSAWTQYVTVLPEAFRLTRPLSPHAAAAYDQLRIDPKALGLPDEETLIVEGAGGLLVPLNADGATYADVCAAWNIPVIVVSRHYLGSINHTLLTAEVLKQRNIPVAGVVFVGDNPASEEIILKVTGLKKIAGIPETDQVDREFVLQEAEKLKSSLKTLCE